VADGVDLEVATDVMPGAELRFSPDGSRILYYAQGVNPGDPMLLRSVAVTGGAAVTLATSPMRGDYGGPDSPSPMQFSPDGSRLLVMAAQASIPPTARRPAPP
jgi:hypothetical protein